NEFECVACLVSDDSEGVLNPDIVPVSMTEAVLDRSEERRVGKECSFQNPRGVVRMKMVRPALRIGSHLNGRIANDVTKILADKCAGIVARCFSRVDDRRINGEQVLQPLAGPDYLRLDELALSNVCSGSNEFECVACLVSDDSEGVLNPDIVPVSMTEAVLD